MPSGGDDGLSDGAVAGIAIAVAVVGVLLGAFGTIACLEKGGPTPPVFVPAAGKAIEKAAVEVSAATEVGAA